MESVDLEIARWVAAHRTAPLTEVSRFLEHQPEYADLLA